MDIFNEEKMFGKVIIVVDRAETKQIIEALDTAIKVNKRRVIWKRILKDLRNKAAVW